MLRARRYPVCALQISMTFPDIPNVTFRTYREGDVPALLVVHDACRERDQIDPYSVCYRLPNLSPEKYAEQITLPDATLIAEVNGEVIAHAFMEAWGFEERLYLWRVWVKPEWRGRGVGTVMHHWGEGKAQEMHGDDTRAGLHLANTTEGEQDATTLLANEGYHLSFISPELAFDTGTAIPSSSAPPGIVLRPLEREHARPVARALCEANLSPEAPATRLEEWEPEWISQVAESDTGLSVAAWEGEQIVGAYLCRRKDKVGEISQVAVRMPWRGRGIARALAMRSLQNLKDAGCVTARLFTSIGPDGEEPGDGPYVMYRKFGFYPIARHLRFRKSL